MLPESVENLIDELAKLPGIGPKSASRLVFYLINKSEEDVQKLGESVLALKKGIYQCQECFNIADQKKCAICRSAKRDRSQIMVVEEPLDVMAMEKTDYQGVYHVLGGVISPIEGVGPEDLRISQLLERLKGGVFQEMILATDPSLEGEATAMYIAKLISKPKTQNPKLESLKITRIARGLPVGGDLEYADQDTLSQAIDGRVKY